MRKTRRAVVIANFFPSLLVHVPPEHIHIATEGKAKRQRQWGRKSNLLAGDGCCVRVREMVHSHKSLERNAEWDFGWDRDKEADLLGTQRTRRRLTGLYCAQARMQNGLISFHMAAVIYTDC